MKKGSVILIPFPFTDLKGSKIRPAIVLYSNERDVTISFITSEIKWKTKHDISILPSHDNGLKVPSLIRVSKIATINTNLVLGELGELSDAEIMQLDENLKELLQIK